MSQDESGYSGRIVILSAIVGALAGAATVLVLAPKTRQETADRIRGASRDLKERAAATIGTAKERLAAGVTRGRDSLDDGRTVLAAAVEAGKQAYARSKSDVPSDG